MSPIPNIDDQLTPSQQYWASIRAKAMELDPEAAARDAAARLINPRWGFRHLEASTKPFYLVSIENRAKGIRGGVVCLGLTHYTAVRLVEGTHRLATQEETEFYEAEQTKKRAAAEVAANSQKAGVDAITAILNAAKGK